MKERRRDGERKTGIDEGRERDDIYLEGTERRYKRELKRGHREWVWRGGEGRGRKLDGQMG